MYINSAIRIDGGTLEVSTIGKNKDGAICLDEKTLNIAAGAKLYEGDKAPGVAVSSVSLKSGLTFNSKDYVKIVLPDVKQESTVPSDTEVKPAKPVIKLKQDADAGSVTITISKLTMPPGITFT